MELSLRIFLAICILVYFTILIVMLKKKIMSLRYTLIWIICGICMVVFTIFPTIIFKGSAFVGISNPVNAIFFMTIVFIVILLLSLTSIISTLNEKNLRLTQSLALLEQRIHMLEQKNKKER